LFIFFLKFFSSSSLCTHVIYSLFRIRARSYVCAVLFQAQGWVANGVVEVMRTSPHWTHRRYGLPQVAIRPQLSCHITLGFSRHVVTVSVITFSYDIKTGRSWMCWKGDDGAVILDLVPAPEGPWIILCDHNKVLCHLFGPIWPCIVSDL
jgi:hypothetical protein